MKQSEYITEHIINLFEYEMGYRQEKYSSLHNPRPNKIFIKIGKKDLDEFLTTKELRNDKRILLRNNYLWFKFVEVSAIDNNMVMLHFTKIIWPKEDEGKWIIEEILDKKTEKWLFPKIKNRQIVFI